MEVSILIFMDTAQEVELPLLIFLITLVSILIFMDTAQEEVNLGGDRVGTGKFQS